MVAKKSEPLTETEQVKLVQDRVDEILQIVDDFTRTHVYVGVPEANNDRGDGSSMGNAALAYVHNYGSFRAHIPARPFMEPGIGRVQEEIEKFFLEGARAALDGEKRKADAKLMMAGGTAANSIKEVIRAGIPPPLKEKTVRYRYKQRQGVTGSHASELLYGDRIREGVSAAALMSIATPLINTSKLINSITFVLTHDEF